MKEINFNQYDEIGKCKKSTQSNISKSKNKSKHKHQYAECLIQYKMKSFGDNKNKIHTCLDSYCTICGKLGGQFNQDKSIASDYTEVIYNEVLGKCYKVMSDEELYEKYHNKLPVFYVENRFDTKYIPLEINDESKSDRE